jgi:hypothetical protein
VPCAAADEQCVAVGSYFLFDSDFGVPDAKMTPSAIVSVANRSVWSDQAFTADLLGVVHSVHN